MVLKIIIYFLILYSFHELGHIISARIMKLRINKIGFNFFPFPHIYVSVSDIISVTQKYVFLFAGTTFTLISAIIIILNHWIVIKEVYYALAIQVILELNPFYSDITIATNNPGYKFSAIWYVHFLIWLLCIFLLLSSDGCKVWFYE